MAEKLTAEQAYEMGTSGQNIVLLVSIAIGAAIENHKVLEQETATDRSKFLITTAVEYLNQVKAMGHANWNYDRVLAAIPASIRANVGL